MGEPAKHELHYSDLPIPAGICKKGTWKVLHLNSAMKALLPQQDYDEDILDRWFASATFTPLAGWEDSAILTLHNGGEYLVNWRDNDPSMEDSRIFTAVPLSGPGKDTAGDEWTDDMHTILDFIHDGIWIIDGHGITLGINKAMERIAGIRADEVVGRHVSEPLAEGRFKTCVTLRALQTRHTVTLFDDYSNGKRCLNTSTPIFDKNGNVWRVIAAIRDITELESLQNRLSDLEVETMAYRLRVQGLENEHGGIIGHSAVLQRIMQDIGKASQTDAITLILGETGTGKSLAAKTIHELGARSQKPFVTVNCGAIPASLMESELFGYEKGAFTGASKNGKPGMLELACGGTLLLDEIGELSLALQAKLLHVLDGEPVFRVGGTRPITLQARIIAATNRPLEHMVAAGTFREDLFYRLRVLCIHIPPLRERKEDILLLASHFLNKICEHDGVVKKLDRRVEQLFLKYSWPGNVRELQSVIQSLVTLCEHDKIIPGDLPTYMRETTEKEHGVSPRNPRLGDAVEELEKKMIGEALAETGSTYKAARRLGISQSSVVRKARKYGLNKLVPYDAPVGERPKAGPGNKGLHGSIL